MKSITGTALSKADHYDPMGLARGLPRTQDSTLSLHINDFQGLNGGCLVQVKKSFTGYGGSASANSSEVTLHSCGRTKVLLVTTALRWLPSWCCATLVVILVVVAAAADTCITGNSCHR